MAQEVLYRKWRPRRFADVVGQDPVVQTLRNAVAAGTPAHAYLLSGPRGTGKTTTGRILAKALNCAAPVEGEPCDACQSCHDYDEGRALDLVEMDAASNRGIDEMRGLRESAGYAPTSGRYKVYLIDEVHMLTDQAFNALLKTLEEPPPHIVFILATTEPHKLPATILSRCQRFDLRRATIEGLVYRLRIIGQGEGFEVAEGGYELIARQANGAWRDAVNLLDQLVAYHGPRLTIEDVRSGLGLVVDRRSTDLARAAIAKDLKAGLALLAEARDNGVEIKAFVKSVVDLLRTILLLKAGAADPASLSDAELEELNQIAAQAALPDIVAALQAFGDVDFQGDAYDSLPAEIAFASLATGLSAAPAASAPAPAMAAPPQRGAPIRPGGGAQAAARAGASPVGTQGRPTTSPPRPAASAPAPEEAPATPAVPFAPPDAGSVSGDLQRLRDAWPDVQAKARKIRVPAGALLGTANNAFPKSVEGDTVTIGFQFEAHIARAQAAENHAALTQAVSEVMGRAMKVVAAHWPELGAAGTAAPQRSSGGHLVEEALKQGARRIDG